MKIGVSGASGKLGSAIVAELGRRAAGHHIVGISRSPAQAQGVEGRLGDYNRPDTLAAAYAGLDRLVLIPTSELAPGVRARQNLAAIDAAVAAGVGHVLLFSSAGTRGVPEPNVWASYFAAEQRLMRSARSWSILRMNYYAESLIDEARMSFAHGTLTGLAENNVAFVSRDDLAAAAAGILTTDGHHGAIYTGTGPASLSGAQRAALIARAAGQPLGFTVIPAEALRAGLAGAQLPPDVVNTVLSIQEGFAAGGFDIVTGDIARLAGRAPRALQDVLASAFARA